MCEGGGEGEFLKGFKKELLKGRLIGPCRGSKIPCTEALDVTPLNPYCKRKDAKPQTRRKPLGASGPESQTPKSPETLRKTLKPWLDPFIYPSRALSCKSTYTSLEGIPKP